MLSPCDFRGWEERGCEGLCKEIRGCKGKEVMVGNGRVRVKKGEKGVRECKEKGGEGI